MPHLFIILFKINLVLILFAGAYYVVLRKLTYYSLNRIFLLFGIVFSSAYPFINLNSLSDRYQRAASIVPEINQGVSDYIKQGNAALYWQAVTALFWTGVVIMAMRLALQFISLYRIHKDSEPGLAADHEVRILNDDLGPFSFWQTIYINPDLHDKHDLDNILRHERVHVEDRHTIDIILAEISLVFYWFNPGVWLMKRAVRENIEFITDARILNKGIDKKKYQYSLLHTGHLMPAAAIVNNFNLSDLKKRIRMMNAKRSSRLALSRYLVLLPVLLVTTLAFTISKKGPEKTTILKPSSVNLINSNPPASATGEIRPAKIQTSKPVLLIAKQDTAKRIMIFKAFDVNPDSVHGSLDVLPEPYPGDRIKMITVRSRTPGDGNVFEAQREVDQTPASVMMNLTNAERPQESNDNSTVVNFFFNGKEITKEEFTKLNLMDQNGIKLGKKLMIHVEKKKLDSKN